MPAEIFRKPIVIDSMSSSVEEVSVDIIKALSEAGTSTARSFERFYAALIM